MKRDQVFKRVREIMRLRHMALATEQCYLGWAARYMDSLAHAPAGASSEQKVERFLTGLAQAGMAASTQNQAFNALLFLYNQVLEQPLQRVQAMRAQRPERIRTAPEVEEVRQLLAAVADVHGYPTRLITHMLYGCGLRVSEPLNLRVQDLRLRESRLIVRSGKGNKDRMVALPCALVVELKAQLKLARVIWERDARAGVPVALPGRLAQKYPHWQFAWTWAWVFPSHHPCAHPRTGVKVRWRCHEANVQRAVKAAARPLGLCVTPHHLRHAYATHVIRQGANIRDVQEALGHAQVETTMGYLTPRACAVPSPLETL